MRRHPHKLTTICLLAWVLIYPGTTTSIEGGDHHRVRHATGHSNHDTNSDTGFAGELNLETFDSSKEKQLHNLIDIGHPKVVTSKAEESFEEKEGYVFDTSQEESSPRQMGGINIKDEARKLANKMRILSNDEIGVRSMQAIYDSLPFHEVQPLFEDKLDELTQQLSAKLNKYLQVLRTNSITAETLYRIHISNPITLHNDCCTLPNEQLKWNDQYSMPISTRSSCDLIPPGASYTFNPGRNLTEVFQQHLKYVPGIKWQYFMSAEGIYNEFPSFTIPNQVYSDCKNLHNNNHRAVYVSTLLPQQKNVLIMVDHGNSLSLRQLNLAKSVAKYILDSLGPQDRVGVIGLSSDVHYPREQGCTSHVLTSFSHESKLHFRTFINKLDKDAVSTNHSLGFSRAFEMIQDSLTLGNGSLSDEKALLIYISRGLLTSLTDAKEVMTTIGQANGRLRHQVTINTHVVIDEGKPILYEKTFMLDVAEQNFVKYLVPVSSDAPVPVGEMIAVTNDENFNSVLGEFYHSLELTYSKKPKVSLPIEDSIGSGIVLPVTWPCFYDSKLLGVMGLDIHFSDVVEGITYFNKTNLAYAFLIDNKGATLMHPSMSRPVFTKSQPMHTKINYFEQHPGFNAVLQKILGQSDGHVTVEIPNEVDNTSASLASFHTQPKVMKVTYLWRHILVNQLDDVPFIVVIKKMDAGFKIKDLDEDIRAPEGNELVYHRLDLLPTDNTCMHLKQLATLDSSALFLSASAFQSPFEYLNQVETKRMVQGYLVYLNDNTGLISNPGIKEHVRRDVAAISQINGDWQNAVRVSKLNDFIVRRYVATPGGAMSVYPGTLINKLYDPTKREWYRRAEESPGKVTLSAPYLDTGGAGYVVTLSHTIYEGKNNALHGPFDRIVAVIGMDITLKYFYKIIEEQLPACQDHSVRCFIMDDRGYLIAHKSLVEPNSLMNTKLGGESGKGDPPEERHISHQERLVANDILNHKGFVRKKLCNSFTDRTMQRYYHFNTSLDRFVTNLVHGEHCAKYQLVPIPGTNAFFGIVNQTCDMMSAFCPCSVVDRLCLNCHRMEQTECECPCECPLDYNFCTDKLLDHEERFPSCPLYPEPVRRAKVTDDVAMKLPQCFPINCNGFRTKRSCAGVVDCEWCELDIDRSTPLQQPFCSTQRVCFSGVVGAQTPYADEVNYKAAQTQGQMNLKSAPVGPVAGGIMGCFLLLALGVYCYRHHVHRHSHHYVTSLPDGNRNSPLDNDIEDLDSPEDVGNGHTNIMLASFENPASISPYRVTSTYRRPNNVESDLGYSTMTPHDDSEQASTTCVEPLIIRDRYRPPPHTSTKKNSILPPPPSTGRRSCSPTQQTQLLTKSLANPSEQTAQAPPPVTVLDNTHLKPHQVIANVQVHMVDSH